MVMQTEVIEQGSHELQESGARLTRQGINTIAEQMELSEELVNKVMRLGIDYGITPGTKGPGLWDAGAAKIIRAFGCHAEHKILFHEESDQLVSWTIEAQLVHPQWGIIGSGLGNASTRETKYKYRWVSKADALREEYTEEEITELKTKATPDGQGILYRIENPEFGELVHTLLVMASKRAECDAAKSLPGVASALRAKFDVKAGKDEMTLPIFWSIMKGSNLTEDDVHRVLQVKSVKDWLSTGKTLREAATHILAIAVKQSRSAKAQASKAAPPGPAATPVEKKPAQIVKEDVPNVDALIALAQKFWNIPEAQVWQALGYSDRQGFAEAMVQTPFEAWQALLEQQLG